MWDAVQEEIARRSSLRAKRQRHSGKHWLSSKLVCGECGTNYGHHHCKGCKYAFLRCINRNTHGKNIRIENGVEIGCSNEGVNELVMLKGMQYILEHIQNSRKDIIADLFEEIRIMQQNDEPVDIAELEAEIEKLENKKKKAIDLMIEELITKEDLKKQTSIYNGEIERLTLEINDNRNSNAVHDRQIKGIQKFIDEVNKATKSNTDDVGLYDELLKKAVLYKNETADFYLNCVPFGFKIAYNSYRKRGEAMCDIISLAVIE